MQEISLNILDLTQNSISAGASLVELMVEELPAQDRLTVSIRDNGRGMSQEQLARVTDPFYTTRTTRSVGLGIPFFKMAAEMTGGSFRITSQEGKGTEVTGEFVLSSIDRMPLGELNETVGILIRCNPSVDFVYTRARGEKSFTLDTQEMRRILGDIPLDSNEVSEFIREYLRDGDREIIGGA